MKFSMNQKLLQHRNFMLSSVEHEKTFIIMGPDLSPIEHLWDHVGRQVRERHDVNNIRDLERALQAEWVRIPL